MKLGQGRDNSKDYLLANPELMAEIEDKIKGSREAEEVATKSNKKNSKLEEKAAAAAEQTAAKKPADDDDDDGDEQFEEFAPVDITGFGN